MFVLLFTSPENLFKKNRKKKKISKSKKNHKIKLHLEDVYTFATHVQVPKSELLWVYLFSIIYANLPELILVPFFFLLTYIFLFLGSIMLKCSFDAVLYTIKVNVALWYTQYKTYTPKKRKNVQAFIFK